MLRGKHVLITLLVIGLLWSNYFVYSTFKLISNDQLSGDEARVGFCVILVVMQTLILLSIIIYNWYDIWNWEFNLKDKFK